MTAGTDEQTTNSFIFVFVLDFFKVHFYVFWDTLLHLFYVQISRVAKSVLQDQHRAKGETLPAVSLLRSSRAALFLVFLS